mmetsp:Transcript_15135/g.22223  ORF Transcript_15135/g.22223 Transcript_15135/m.22223 type:complete len:251 (-) Transcript_15135:59-811(-)
MDAAMKDNEVGTAKVVEGIMDGVRYFIFNLKEPGYVSKRMSTYGCLAEEGDETSQRLSVGTKKFFKYVQCFYNHFHYRHVVDDHNNFCMSEPCIEKSWVTAFWENRVFAFVLAISEVKTWLAKQYFVAAENYMALLQMRTQLASELVRNPYLDIIGEKDDDVTENVETGMKSKRICMTIDHEFNTCPMHASKFTTDRKLIFSNTNPYQKKTCKGSGCKKMVQTYCSCCVGHWICVQFWGNQRAAVGTEYL